MSFFGFEQPDLEREKLRYKQGAPKDDDVAVYTWGEESYDGLGDFLQEGGDDLNDETFGGALPVGKPVPSLPYPLHVLSLRKGKDFDFSSQNVPDEGHQEKEFSVVHRQPIDRDDAAAAYSSNLPQRHPEQARKCREWLPFSMILLICNIEARANTRSLQEMWDSKSSPLSVLGRMGSSGNLRQTTSVDARHPSPAIGRYTPVAEAPQHLQQTRTNGNGHTGVRTLQEIEAEMMAQRNAALRQQQELRERQQEEEALRLHQQQQELELRRQQQLLYQEQQHQLQVQRALLQQQQQQRQHNERTPPPRMLPGSSQSPRFLEHQRQILYLQQQQDLQQQQRLHDLQEQLRYEEMERAMARTNLGRPDTRSPSQYPPPRQASRPSAAEVQAAQFLQQQQQRQRQRSRSPAVHPHYRLAGASPDNYSYAQNNQQRAMELAQAELMRELQGASQADQEALRHEAMRKILETEKMEEKRRRKAAKIAHMVRD
jgi:DNA topoisomerase 2-associated protein PAT1